MCNHVPSAKFGQQCAVQINAVLCCLFQCNSWKYNCPEKVWKLHIAIRRLQLTINFLTGDNKDNSSHSHANLSGDELTGSQDQTVPLSADPPLSGSGASCQCSSSHLHWRHCRSTQAERDLERERGRASTTHRGPWGVGGSRWETWPCSPQHRQHSEWAPVLKKGMEAVRCRFVMVNSFQVYTDFLQMEYVTTVANTPSESAHHLCSAGGGS